MPKNRMGEFTKNTFITFLANVLQLFFALISSIIIARTLGPEGKGIYAMAIFLPSMIINFGNFGIGQASIFYLGKKIFSVEKTLKNNVALSILFSVIGIFVGIIIIFLWGNSLFPDIEKNYFLISLFLIIPTFFSNFINYLLLGIKKTKEYNYINILRSLLFFLLILLFLLIFKLNIKTAIVANVISISITTCITIWLLKNSFNFTEIEVSKQYLKKIFKYGFKIYLANLIQFFHYKIDIFLINIFLNPLSVGFYSIATTLAEQILLIPQSVGLVLFPKISNENNKKNLKNFTPIVCRNILFITFLGLILLFFLSKIIITTFYSITFANAIIPFKILTIGILTLSGWKILANDIYGRGKASLNIYINATALTLNIILNIILIPKYGINGAALASSISYTIAFIIMLFVFSKVSENKIIDIILIKKSDFKYYKNFIISLRNRCI